MDKITLCSKEKCTGCGICVNACRHSAISLQEDAEGFLYPHINNGVCVACHLCQKVCPVLEPVQRYDNGKCFAAWSKNTNIRAHSSSGGIFSELAFSILQQSGIVVGASLNDTTGFVNHIIIEDKSELHKLQGSKYVQSIITTDVLKQTIHWLRDGRKVLFTGTPCQVAGIISLTHNPDNLYTMDLVCHGTPSPKFFSQIHKSIRNRIKHFQHYYFRNLSGWDVCSNVTVAANGHIKNHILQGEETLYQDAFLKGYLHRESCYQCEYANTQRVADITVGDFWGIGTKRPITDDYKFGCSMLLVNTAKGNLLFGKITDRIYFEPRDINETAEKGNDQLKMPSARPPQRDTFYKDAYSIPYKGLIKKYELTYNPIPQLSTRLKSFLKRLITTIRK